MVIKMAIKLDNNYDFGISELRKVILISLNN